MEIPRDPVAVIGEARIKMPLRKREGDARRFEPSAERRAAQRTEKIRYGA